MGKKVQAKKEPRLRLTDYELVEINAEVEQINALLESLDSLGSGFAADMEAQAHGRRLRHLIAVLEGERPNLRLIIGGKSTTN